MKIGQGYDKKKKTIKLGIRKVKQEKTQVAICWRGYRRRGDGKEEGGCCTSHPVCDLWVAAMTDGESL